MNTPTVYRFTTLTPAVIAKAFAGSDFGEGAEPEELLANGILQIQAGFRTGGTLMGILVQLGVVTRRYHVTKVGRMFLFDFYHATRPARAAVTKPAHPSPDPVVVVMLS